MRVAVLSGKGGTGKTTVAVNLAAAMGWAYLDCDVEEPNGWLYLQPKLETQTPVSVWSPRVDAAACTGCGACARACQFHALAVLSTGVKLFPQLCHGCGLCSSVCPKQAISEQPRTIGHTDWGQAANGRCGQGVLQVGEPSGVPIIDRLLASESVVGSSLLDCAPGTSCHVVAAARAADFALLVTEATPFGAHDLELALQLVQALQLPAAVVINRFDGEEGAISQLAHRHAVPIVARLPFSRQAAALSAQGGLLNQQPPYREAFWQLGRQLEELIGCS